MSVSYTHLFCCSTSTCHCGLSSKRNLQRLSVWKYDLTGGFYSLFLCLNQTNHLEYLFKYHNYRVIGKCHNMNLIYIIFCCCLEWIFKNNIYIWLFWLQVFGTVIDFDKLPFETILWLLVTAGTILTFTLGHYYIEVCMCVYYGDQHRCVCQLQTTELNIIVLCIMWIKHYCMCDAHIISGHINYWK